MEVGLYENRESSIIESFCNKVSSEALLIRSKFESEWNRINKLSKLEECIEKLSKTFKISEEAIARRLLEDGRITIQKYENLREYYQARWQEIKELEKKRMKQAKGGPSFYVRKVANNGYAYTQTVISAFKGGQISGRESSALLGVKVNHIPKLASAAGLPLYAKG